MEYVERSALEGVEPSALVFVALSFGTNCVEPFKFAVCAVALKLHSLRMRKGPECGVKKHDFELPNLC